MELVEASWDKNYIIDDSTAIELSRLISIEKNDELREAMEYFDSFLCGF